MKRLVYRLSLMAAAVMFFSIPARSDEGSAIRGNDMGVTGAKDECLIVAKNCSAESIQTRIERLENEIKRGTDVYTRDELRELESQINFYKNDILLLERDRG
jgi:hypothetical protein